MTPLPIVAMLRSIQDHPDMYVPETLPAIQTYLNGMMTALLLMGWQQAPTYPQVYAAMQAAFGLTPGLALFDSLQLWNRGVRGHDLIAQVIAMECFLWEHGAYVPPTPRSAPSAAASD